MLALTRGREGVFRLLRLIRTTHRQVPGLWSGAGRARMELGLGSRNGA